MKFFKNVLIYVFKISDILFINSVFLTSGLRAAKLDSFENVTREEVKEHLRVEFDAALKDALDRLSPSTKKAILNEIKLVAGVLILGTCMGSYAYTCAVHVWDWDYKTHWGCNAFGFDIGLLTFIISYVLLKVIDKKIINSKSDIEDKLKMLEVLELMNSMD